MRRKKKKGIKNRGSKINLKRILRDSKRWRGIDGWVNELVDVDGGGVGCGGRFSDPQINNGVPPVVRSYDSKYDDNDEEETVDR